jgi:hypothetical protein
VSRCNCDRIFTETKSAIDGSSVKLPHEDPKKPDHKPEPTFVVIELQSTSSSFCLIRPTIQKTHSNQYPLESRIGEFQWTGFSEPDCEDMISAITAWSRVSEDAITSGWDIFDDPWGEEEPADNETTGAGDCDYQPRIILEDLLDL